MLQVILLFALALSRACNIWLCSRAVNLLRPPEMKVPDSHQVRCALPVGHDGVLHASGRGTVSVLMSADAQLRTGDDVVERSSRRHRLCAVAAGGAGPARLDTLLLLAVQQCFGCRCATAAVAAMPIAGMFCCADGKGEVMLTCTFFIILITVLVNGGACADFIDRLHLRAQDSSSRQ